MNLGVIGTGRIGKVHILTISQMSQVKVKAVADPFVDLDFAKDMGIEIITTDHQEIMNDPQIQAVLICSPTDTHSKLILECLEKEKHIFCEKPLDLDIKKALEMVEAIKKNHLVFQIGFNRRFDHNYKSIAQQIQKGVLGQIYTLTLISRDPSPPSIEYLKTSGGIFKDMSIHDFDMIRFLSGQEVKEAYVQSAIFTNIGMETIEDVDTVNITLTLEKNTIGLIHNSRESCYGYDQRAEVFGEKGILYSSNDRISNVMTESEQGLLYQNPYSFFLDRYPQAYQDEIFAFVSAIQNQKPSMVSSKDAIEPLFIAEACQISLQEQRPVFVEEVKKKYGVIL